MGVATSLCTDDEQVGSKPPQQAAPDSPPHTPVPSGTIPLDPNHEDDMDLSRLRRENDTDIFLGRGLDAFAGDDDGDDPRSSDDSCKTHRDSVASDSDSSSEVNSLDDVFESASHNGLPRNPLSSPTQPEVSHDRHDRQKFLRKSAKRRTVPKPIVVDLPHEEYALGEDRMESIVMPSDMLLGSRECSISTCSSDASARSKLDRRQWIREAVASGRSVSSFSASASLITLSRAQDNKASTHELRSPPRVTFY